MSNLSWFSLALLLLGISCPLAQAQVTVPTAASFALNGGSLDLAGTGLQVAGEFGLGAGNVNNAANVAIAASGNLNGGSGTLNLFGDWSNSGSFIGGTGNVNFSDGGIVQSNVGGNTQFNNVSFLSSNGKNYLFAVGSTQSISGLLAIQGTAAQGIQFKSTAAGQVASIDLLSGGSQNIQYVGVSDLHAIGQHLAAAQTNDGGTGNDTGWFGSGSSDGGNTVATPTLSIIGLLLLALLMAISASFAFIAPRQPGKITS